MLITSKGQVTIPQHIRQSAGFLPNTHVEFIETPNGVFIKKMNKPSQRSEQLLKSLSGKASVSMTTDEIMALTRGYDDE